MLNLSGRIVCCLLLLSQGTTPTPQPSQNAPAPTTALIEGCQQPCLEDGTPVKLRIAETVSSADAHVNQQVEFEVLEEIRVSDVLIIPKGGIAWGTVTEAEPKRRMARGGKLEIVMDSVRLADGEKAALRASKEVKGGGHTGAMTAGIVATALIVWPAAPFFLFMHGKDITIPKGTEIPTFVNGNFQLDLSRFQKPVMTAAAPAPGSTSHTAAELAISSNPSGADIQVDGAFVGNTPSTVGVSAGDHTIDVAAQGYQTWERKIKVTSGKIEITANLIANAAPTSAASAPTTSTAPSPAATSPAPAPPVGGPPQ